MNDENTRQMCEKLVPKNYLQLAYENNKVHDKLIRILLEKKKLPEAGWKNITIEYFVNELARMDSNNFVKNSGLGEREGRVVCDLVARRHYNLSHGIGRSGDLSESQPKAAGSSIMANLTNHMILDLIQTMGVRLAKKCLLVPMATGMSLVICFLAIRREKPNARYILWSRIDQKSCFKSMVTAGFVPIIIEPLLMDDDQLTTNVKEFEDKIAEIGPENILAIHSTTSCFAPRSCDNLVELSQLAKHHNIHHVVNNAYGLQSTFLTHQIEQGIRLGRIDLFVQSSDKNLLVPVGGCIVASSNPKMVDVVAKTYAGRASSSQTLDVFMTLLSLGRDGYKKLVDNRKLCFDHLRSELSKIAETFGERLFTTKQNPISIAISLKSFDREKCSEIGSLLFTRGISGARVIDLTDVKTIESYEFVSWGSHSSQINSPYLTVAAGLGAKIDEIDQFIKKIVKIFEKVKN